MLGLGGPTGGALVPCVDGGGGGDPTSSPNFLISSIKQQPLLCFPNGACGSPSGRIARVAILCCSWIHPVFAGGMPGGLFVSGQQQRGNGRIQDVDFGFCSHLEYVLFLPHRAASLHDPRCFAMITKKLHRNRGGACAWRIRVCACACACMRARMHACAHECWYMCTCVWCQPLVNCGKAKWHKNHSLFPRQPFAPSRNSEVRGPGRPRDVQKISSSWTPRVHRIKN